MDPIIIIGQIIRWAVFSLIRAVMVRAMRRRASGLTSDERERLRRYLKPSVHIEGCSYWPTFRDWEEWHKYNTEEKE